MPALKVREQRPDRFSVATRITSRQRDERLGNGGWKLVATLESVRQLGRFPVLAAHEACESRCVAADRALRLRGTRLQRPVGVCQRTLPVARDEA